MAGGGLIPDDVVVGIVAERGAPGLLEGFILDGFPRSAAAAALDALPRPAARSVVRPGPGA